MYKIAVKQESEVLVGEHLFNVENYLPKTNVFIITDKNINRLYSNQFPDFPVIEIGEGEAIKTLSTVEFIVRELLELKADRHSFLLGIGGGIVCDITGFVASIYMRGIDFAFVSSSLLSQVDASVGGKNGVNFDAYKNIIGNFNQPKFVICDTQMLNTLPQEEWRSGMGEVLKHALISDREMFEQIHELGINIFKQEEAWLSRFIFENIKIKADIVEQDEKERGERKKLNLGHTLAHAIEKQKTLSHGEAVAIGLVFASEISHRKQYITKDDLDVIKQTIRSLGFNIDIELDKTQLKEAVLKDKKRNQADISFVLLEEIGKAKIETLSLDELNQWIDDLC